MAHKAGNDRTIFLQRLQFKYLHSCQGEANHLCQYTVKYSQLQKGSIYYRDPPHIRTPCPRTLCKSNCAIPSDSTWHQYTEAAMQPPHLTEDALYQESEPVACDAASQSTGPPAVSFRLGCRALLFVGRLHLRQAIPEFIASLP